MKHFQLGSPWESELDYGHLSINLNNKHFGGISNVPGSVLDIEDLTVNKTEKVPSLKDYAV